MSPSSAPVPPSAQHFVVSQRKTGHEGAPDSGDGLERLLGKVEQELADLGLALRQRDTAAIESHAATLRDALEHAVDGFSAAARQGTVPPPLRSRLARAGGQVAAQRETLARATFALDRAIETLIPKDANSGYRG